jgi:hypothetical protein
LPTEASKILSECNNTVRLEISWAKIILIVGCISFEVDASVESNNVTDSAETCIDTVFFANGFACLAIV